MAKSIKQTVQFKVSPKVLYDALMSTAKHAAFTEDKASISKKVGGKFSCYSGYISGVNIELKPGKRIVQAWRGSDFHQWRQYRIKAWKAHRSSLAWVGLSCWSVFDCYLRI